MEIKYLWNCYWCKKGQMFSTLTYLYFLLGNSILKTNKIFYCDLMNIMQLDNIFPAELINTSLAITKKQQLFCKFEYNTEFHASTYMIIMILGFLIWSISLPKSTHFIYQLCCWATVLFYFILFTKMSSFRGWKVFVSLS